MIEEYQEARSNQAGQPLPHYVCTGGCRVYSEMPGACPTPGCVRVRNPLTKCECQDGLHSDLITKNATKISR